MERREFLKAIASIAAVPAICTTGLSKIIGTSDTKSNFTEINFDNIKTTGTFDEWIESIRTEIERMLAGENHGDSIYSVEVRSSDWGVGKESLPAKAIVIMYAGIGDMVIFESPREITYFDFAKFEFEHNKTCPEGLKNLVTVRFIDMQWSLENQRERYFKLLRRFDPKHKTPDDYLH